MNLPNKTITFLTELFGHTQNNIWVQALGNGGGGSKGDLATRDMAEIAKYTGFRDTAGNGVYFCVCTTSGARTKEDVQEIVGLHTDIDFKDVVDAPQDIEKKLTTARLLPSIINDSGNGLHGYWLFKEPLSATPENQARVEAALKLLADLFGGDMAVTHCAALMRLPGTHNTKHGEWDEVITIFDSPARYELDDLEEWLAETSPVILRKERPAQVFNNDPGANVFLTHAMALGFKPPIDVEARLAKMSYMGGGEAAIHQTQLAVSASMLRAGAHSNTVIATLLDATRAAAKGYGERWNWQREERAIAKMCSDWLKKHPAEEIQQPKAAAGASNVVLLAPARAQKAALKGASHHVILGSAVLGAIRARGDDLLVMPDEIWSYHDGLWSRSERHWLEVELETGVTALELPSSIKLINEARQWLLRQPELFREEVEWDSHGKIATRSGLLDIATMTVEAARPEHLATWRIECAYDPAVGCPWWLMMLNDFFGDRPEDVRYATISTLQELLGAALLEDKSRELTRALVLQGPSEAGKTRILDVFAGLFGGEPISTQLEALNGTHGLMEFRRRAPWILHEAFNAGVWHLSSVVKSILTGDPVQINIKNGPLITQRIKIPVFWATNNPPQFKEATKAIVNRLIVIKCRTTFDPAKLIGAAAEAQRLGLSGPSELILEKEMSGLLNWAVEGLLRALARGYIATTPEMVATLEEVRQDSNLVAGFIDECCDYVADGMVSVPDFCAAFSVWWGENKGEDRRTPSNESIGKAMSALGDKNLAIDKSIRDEFRRYYAGANLNAIGLDFWQGAAMNTVVKGKTTRISGERNSVNRTIPVSWKYRPAIITLRHATVRPEEGLADTEPKF